MLTPPLSLSLSLSLTLTYLLSLTSLVATTPVGHPTAIEEPPKTEPEPEPETEETWTIVGMKEHFYTPATGFNWPWPAGKVFDNATMDFQLHLPTGPATCHASWSTSASTLSSGSFPPHNEFFFCEPQGGPSRDEELIAFALTPYGTMRPELSFVLRVFRFPGPDATPLVAATPVTGLNYSSPFNRLLCANYAPYDGMWCEQQGGGAGEKGGIVLEAKAMLKMEDWEDGTDGADDVEAGRQASTDVRAQGKATTGRSPLLLLLDENGKCPAGSELQQFCATWMMGPFCWDVCR